MASRRFAKITFDEIIRDAFDAGFRSLSGDPIRPEPRSRKREMSPAEAHLERIDRLMEEK
jgi:hypothetical protein